MGSTLVGQIHLGSLKDLEDGVVGVGRELSFVPIDETIDLRLVVGPPGLGAHGIDRDVVLDTVVGTVEIRLEEAGLAYGGGTGEEEIEGLEGSTTAHGDNLVEIVDNGLVASPGVKDPEL